MILVHDTTRARAEHILRVGPNPRFREPGGEGSDNGFSMTLEAGPIHFGTPEDYARGKANEFPDEGGPVILGVDVPDDVVLKVLNDWFPPNSGP
jgi:hypothetical protein